jgi:hypothetical protein
VLAQPHAPFDHLGQPDLLGQHRGGQQPAPDTRFGSSQLTDTLLRLWDARIYQVPSGPGNDWRREPSSLLRGRLVFQARRTIPTSPVHPG